MINFKHLQYFWAAAKQGGIIKASQNLHITPQTISGQIRLLEQQLDRQLFKKAGRNLELTDVGRIVLSYADEIFSIAAELEQAAKTAPESQSQLLKIGISDAVPKSIAYRLISPAMEIYEPVRFNCKENSLESLLAELALHRLDLILADGPIPNGLGVRGYSHKLGDCGISFLATASVCSTLKGSFPDNLNYVPFLMPSELSYIQPNLIHWFEQNHISPLVIGEFDDSALMKAFGQAGRGVFVVPTAIAEEVANQHQVNIIGATEDVREYFYAISPNREITNPAILAITEGAKDWLS